MLRLKKIKGEISLDNSIIAKGTSKGLALRLNGNLDYPQLKELLSSFLLSKKGFLSGKNNQISFEWVASEPDKALVELLKKEVLEQYGLSLKDSTLFKEFKANETAVNKSSSEQNELLGGLSTLETLKKISANLSSNVIRKKDADFTTSTNLEDSLNWNQPNALIVTQTLRSGQKIESEECSVVVIGDVNHGSEIIAAGNIIVLGALRGVAHAGAFDDETQDKFIFALSLLPTQLRIGGVITRGIGDDNQRSSDFTPEFARVEGDTIVVQSYQPRKLHF
jgi:septum site-determining protein MinC